MTFENLHPKQLPIWPLLFITVACGAVSGFHATQSPIMSRCLKDESMGRPVFYGAMVAEGIIALCWAAAGVTFYDGTPGLGAALKEAGPGGVVYEICNGFMGAVGIGGVSIGAVLAMLGVIACPITSGDTAFRSARLTLADWLNIPQKEAPKRLIIAVPMLAIGLILSQMDFSIIWRYFSWANQTLAMITLWMGTAYLYLHKPGSYAYVVALLPAIFMSAVTTTYLLQAPEGFGLPTDITYPAGIGFAILFTLLFIRAYILRKRTI